ncbi:MAG: transposase [Sphingobacteriales bacterium]|nr:MAG: transposase [Sphingobacteriales bacterium]
MVIKEVVIAIFYVLCTGCQLQIIPHDLPNWSTVHDYFTK